MNFDTSKNENGENKIEIFYKSMVYIKKLKLVHLLGFYYLVSWKIYSKKENTKEPILAFQQLKKLIISFYKKYVDKQIINSPLINTALPMAWLTIEFLELAKQK